MIEPFEQNPNAVAIVRVQDGQTFANSRDVAALFGKRHDDLLRKFDSLDCSEEFRLRNFAETVQTRPNPSGGGDIASRVFDMTRDGFAFVAFGFTGKRAAKFKEDYIAAYNAKDAEVARRAEIAASSSDNSLALAIETNDSLAEIERNLHSIHTGLGSKIDALAHAIIGSLIKHVGRPIMDRMDANQRWNERRFEAIHSRDKTLIQSLSAKQDSDDCVSIAVAQTMMGVPMADRSPRLSRNLSGNAVHWFAARGYTAKPDPSHASGPWVFQKSKVRQWWEASGRDIYQREAKAKSGRSNVIRIRRDGDRK